MSASRPCPAARPLAWTGLVLGLASAFLLGCGGGGGGGGGTSAPAKPSVQTGVWDGTLTPTPGGTAIDAGLVVLADNATNGTVRLLTQPASSASPVYQVTGAFVLDPATAILTSNGPLTVYAPAGQSFSGSPTTQCSFSGSLSGRTMTGTLSGPAFNASMKFTAEDLPAATFAGVAGTYITLSHLLSTGEDAALVLKADGTFTGLTFPAGTLLAVAGGAPLDASMATATLDNGTMQFVTGSSSVVRMEATLLGTAAGAVQSGFSGLGVFGVDPKTSAKVLGVLLDNTSSGFAGTLARIKK